MTIAGYVPAIGETDLDKIIRSIRNLYENISTTTSSGVSSLNGQTGAVVVKDRPGGRLSVSSATPVMTATVSAAATVYYTPYVHDSINIYDGTNWVPTSFAELSQALSDTAKSPAAAAANKNYDLFVWNDSGTVRCTRGPAWTSDSARGTGAGTTELERISGVLLNKNAITNGPAADRGIYVGTIRTNGSSVVDWTFGSAASGGGAASFGVWNYYNRASIGTAVQDSGAAYAYAVAAWRQARASAGNQAQFIIGYSEDSFVCGYQQEIQPGGNFFADIGIGVNSASSPSTMAFANGAGFFFPSIVWIQLSPLGWNTVYGLENSASAASVLYGNSTAGFVNLTLQVPM